MLTKEPWNKASHELAGARQGSMGTRLARDYTPHWCSLGEPGNKASLGIVLRTGAHQGSLGMRLALRLYLALVLTKGAGDRGYIALGLYSALVLTKGAWEREKNPGRVLCTGAHQESLGTRLAMSPYWCSSGEPRNKSSPGIVLHTGAHQGDLGARLAMGVNSALMLTRRA